MVRIAVVEDEALSRQLLADYLARYSDENGVTFDITYFEDGGALIGGYKPVYDIILMDIQMTHVDGMTAARAIRDSWLSGGGTVLPHEAPALVRVLTGALTVPSGRC